MPIVAIRIQQPRPRPYDTQAVCIAVVRRRRTAILAAVLATVQFTEDLLQLNHDPPIPMHTSILTGTLWLNEILLGHPGRCRNQFGMSATTFMLLFAEMTLFHGLEDSQEVTAQEKLAIIVYFFVHGSSQRELMERFQRSGDTISRYIGELLELMASALFTKYVKAPANEIPEKISSNPRFFPYFSYARGATDCVHIDAYVLSEDFARYRDRHGNLSQNVIATCDFDMRYLHVMAGYEGTAGDSLVFDYAHRYDNFRLPDRCYYLADAGFPLCDMLMTPYRGKRYHLNEYRRGNRRPQDHEELFNFRHAQLRNEIERIFGVDKRKFRILVSRPGFSYRKQAMIVCGVTAVHNFMRIHEPASDNGVDDEELDFDLEGHPFIAHVLPQLEEVGSFDISRVELVRAGKRRDAIAKQMWDDYVVYLQENNLL